MSYLDDQKRSAAESAMLEAEVNAEEKGILAWAEDSGDDIARLVEQHGTPRQKTHHAAGDLDADEIMAIVMAHG